MYGNTSEHHAINDELLPTLTLQPAVEVRIDIEETGVKLFIGPREYEWPRCCPDSLLSKDGVLHPAGWAAKRRFVGISKSCMDAAARFLPSRRSRSESKVWMVDLCHKTSTVKSTRPLSGSDHV